MKKKPVLYIVMPAYNEAVNIRKVINAWYPVIEKFGEENSRLVIFDDGSKDETYSIMLDEKKNHPLFIPITKENSGHGATVLAAYHYAINHGADFVFQTDSDGQTLPEEFESFWALRDSFDMVIGNRHNRHDGFFRVFVTFSLRYILRIIFGVNLIDPNTPFRLMNAVTLKKFIDLIPKDYNLSNVLLSVIYAKNNLGIKYLPITFRPRQGGKNSINVRRIISIGWQAMKDFIALSKKV
ncbi:MAG: glycosyltransferase family 2 protein [Selenomonadaceae bacterium]|nr:glycosyltransferase family 2 protein [Selenomonadaceae bacterium]